jgi:hypothetical protein
MTSTMNDAIRDFLGSGAYDSMSSYADAIAIVLLIVLLVEQELVRAYAPSFVRPGVRPLKVAIGPLLLTFVLVVVVRGLGLR